MFLDNSLQHILFSFVNIWEVVFKICFFVCSPKKIVEYGKIGGKNVNCAQVIFFFGLVRFILYELKKDLWLN